MIRDTFFFVVVWCAVFAMVFSFLIFATTGHARTEHGTYPPHSDANRAQSNSNDAR